MIARHTIYRRRAQLARVLVLTLSVLCAAGPVVAAQISRGAEEAPHRGVYEIALKAEGEYANPYTDLEFNVTFKRPDNSTVRVDGFFDGGNTFKARAYCDAVGEWGWESRSDVKGLGGKTGSFQVVPSNFKGKLRKHPDDPHQFARDNGEWFLHVGDTGYRYVTATEPKWREYIDQAARAGFTKIRTWFCQGRSDVQVLFDANRSGLNLEYWREIDRRVTYALENHTDIVLKMILYGEDTEELRRYGRGDAMSNLIAQYAQARWSAFPNIYWCISNDREIVTIDKLRGRQVRRSTIDRIGRDMAAREPWGTLITNHQSRFKGYDFVGADWSDVITIEDMDQVTGEILLKHRAAGDDPVVNDEDRYEHHRKPAHPRYFFRRLMWGSLLSGGNATYGGLRTYEAYDGPVAEAPNRAGKDPTKPDDPANQGLRGVQGYFDAVKAGALDHGADDFVHIHKFFKDTGLTLVGMTPNDAAVGGNPIEAKCISGHGVYIIYLANPSVPEPGKADVGGDVPAVDFVFEPMENFTTVWNIRWFNPRTGKWIDGGSADNARRQIFHPPGPGDWVLLLLDTFRPRP